MLGVVNKETHILIDSFCGQRNRISHILTLNQLDCPPRNTDAITLFSQQTKLLDPTGMPVWIREVKATFFIGSQKDLYFLG